MLHNIKWHYYISFVCMFVSESLLVELCEQSSPLPVREFLQQQQFSLLSLPLPQREGDQRVSVQRAAFRQHGLPQRSHQPPLSGLLTDHPSPVFSPLSQTSGLFKTFSVAVFAPSRVSRGNWAWLISLSAEVLTPGCVWRQVQWTRAAWAGDKGMEGWLSVWAIRWKAEQILWLGSEMDFGGSLYTHTPTHRWWECMG